MASTTIHPNRGAAQIRDLLAQPEIAGLVADLVATRWTGRKGYPVRTMVGMVADGEPTLEVPPWPVPDDRPRSSS